MSSSDDVIEMGEVTQSTYDPDESEHVGEAMARLDAKEDFNTHTHFVDVRKHRSQRSSEKQWTQRRSHTVAKPSVTSISGPFLFFTNTFTLSGNHNDNHKRSGIANSGAKLHAHQEEVAETTKEAKASAGIESRQGMV